MKPTIPITRRIEGIKRDTRSPQRLGYPIYHTRTPLPKKDIIIRDALYGLSALIVICTVLVTWHYLSH